ncbi:MAG: PDZ domain-containing protein [Sedimentisphaerales bacterium]|nr:PDZ domain-containing protein [Sedimentisphaerales bacterium]
MKARIIMPLILIACLCAVTAHGMEKTEKQRGYIGIEMDDKPLPELLIKHLQLDEDQGIRIRNVGAGTPADKAGLERDDIIIAFEGEKTADSRAFAEAVRQAGADAKVSLEIIHLGQRQKIDLTLIAFGADYKPKYPPEPVLVESWQPGRMFRFEPGVENWIETSAPWLYELNTGDRTKVRINKQFDDMLKEVRTYHFSTDGRQCSVTIKGDPRDDDSQVTVRIGDEEHVTTVGGTDKLPEKFQKIARDTIKKARNSAWRQYGMPGIVQPALPNAPDIKIFQEHLDRQIDKPGMPAPELRNDALERLEEQIRRLQKRIEELEKSNAPRDGARRDVPEPDNRRNDAVENTSREDKI